MSAACVPSLDGLHRAFRRPGPPFLAFVFLLTLAAACLGSDELKAQTPGADAPPRAEPLRTDQPWCLQRSETDRPNCIYDNFPSCFLAGFKEGGNCISNPGPAATAPPPDQAPRRRAARQASPPPQAQSFAAQPQTAQAAAQPAQPAQAEREKLFNDFQTWRAQRADSKTH
jgi:hypothetical protein